MMAAWQCAKWKDRLSSLDGKVALAISCKKHWYDSEKQVIVTNFTSPEQAASAFVGTGAISEKYDGMTCHE